MANNKILIFIRLSIFYIHVAGISGAITQKPLNAAAGETYQAVFNCSSDTAGAIAWLYSIDCNAADGMPLTENNCDVPSNYTYMYKYRTEKPDEFSCNLILFYPSMSHGGCYVCADGVGPGRQYQAMLVVVGKISTTTGYITPGDLVVLNTTFSYRGPSIPQQPPPLPPSFYWTLESDPTQNITSYEGPITNTSASSFIVVEAQPPIVPSYICHLFFNPPVVVPADCASNAPISDISSVTPPLAIPTETPKALERD